MGVYTCFRVIYFRNEISRMFDVFDDTGLNKTKPINNVPRGVATEIQAIRGRQNLSI